jgi:hypothetical protein
MSRERPERRRALSALFPVDPEAVAALEAELLLRRNQWCSGLGLATTLHSAKLAVLPGEVPALWFESSFDGELGEHLDDLWEAAGTAFADILRHTGAERSLDRAGFGQLLGRSARRSAADRSGHGGRPRSVIDNDARLDQLAQRFLDTVAPGSEPLSVFEHLRSELVRAEVWLGQWPRTTEHTSWVERLRLRGLRRGLRSIVGTDARRRVHPASDKERRGVGLFAQTSSLWLFSAPPSGTRRDRLRRWAEVWDRDAEARELQRIHSARVHFLDDGRLLLSLIADGSSAMLQASLPPSSLRDLLGGECVEVGSQIWYSAYPELSVHDVLRNERARELLVEPLSASRVGALSALF